MYPAILYIDWIWSPGALSSTLLSVRIEALNRHPQYIHANQTHAYSHMFTRTIYLYGFGHKYAACQEFWIARISACRFSTGYIYLELVTG